MKAQTAYQSSYQTALQEKDTLKMIRSLKMLGDSLSEEGDYRSGDSILMAALHLSETTKERYETGILLNLLGSNASYTGNRPLALSYYHRALKEFYDIRDADKVAMIMMNMGSEYEYAGDLKKAIAYKLKALKNKIASGKTKNLDYYYQHIGQLFKETDTDKWEFYVKKAYEVSKTLEDSRIQTRAAIFNDLGGISKLRGKNEEALAWYDSLLNISIANEYLTGQGTAYSNRSLIYMADGRYQEALDDIVMAIDIAGKTGKVYAHILDRIHAANILEKMNQMQRAEMYARQALTMAQELRYYPEEEVQAHLALARIGERSKNWKMAYEHYNDYKEGLDSLRSVDVEKNMHDLEVKYRTAEKEKEIERLDHENSLKSLSLKRRQTQLVAVMLIAVLIAIIGFLWSRRKLSENRKQQAELKEKMLRSQMNPHFIFNTLNAINQYIQQDKGGEASDYLVRYARLMRQILENSGENYILLADELEFLNNYLCMQQLRFGNSFSFEIRTGKDVDPEKLAIPPMIAQPFIENAVEHGVRGVKEGAIKVEFELKDKELVLTVTDNGVGFQLEEGKTHHRSMALEITRERLRMLGGKPESLHFVSPLPGCTVGTCVSLRIPFIV
ncbi:MAG: histidine kinase [Paludibacter sp.]|jgi:tetratricopeptide (TPR) repeat protein|nr:histidine kinase [Paludibacter sp.]